MVFSVYGVLFFIAILGVVVRIMSRKAIIVSFRQVYMSLVVAILIPLLVSSILLVTSIYKLSSESNSPINTASFVLPILCLSVFIVLLGVVFFYALRRSMGEIILINIEEQKVFESLKSILENSGIVYTEKQSLFLFDGGKGSICVVTKMKANFSSLQFTNAKQYIPVVLNSLKKDFENYKVSQKPWWSLMVFLPFLPLLFFMLSEIPGLKNILVIDLDSFGEWPRTIGGYGTWGMYLSGQIIGFSSLLLAIRVWIKKPLIMTFTSVVSRIGAMVIVIHAFSLFFASLINYSLHLVMLIMCLLLTGLTLYYMKMARKYYGFMNISPEQVNETLIEVLTQRNISFLETRHVIVLQDGSEIKIQKSRQYVGMEFSQAENHNELVKDFLGILKTKPATILASDNLLILFAALMIVAYWFSPYLSYFLFR